MRAKKKLLIIEDQKLLGLLSDFLNQFDKLVVTALTADDGLRKLRASQADLVILDVMLPGKDGLQACRDI
jgi:DNA-binding response OmpR family regulator